jgi:hypothetical protein
MSITTSERARSSAPPPPDVDADHTAGSRRDFCRALKAARERRGVTIARIAEVTKVCPSHFEALERGDLGHWPHGLFRRAFFRGYAEMIGVPVADTVDEFIRLFPGDAAGSPAPARAAAATDAPRLVLDDSWRGTKVPIGIRAAAAAIDAILLLAAGAAAWFSRTDPAIVIAIAIASYFMLATVVFGASPAVWALQRRTVLWRTWRARAAPPTSEFDAAAEPAAEFRVGKEESWTTDARRVRPSGIPPRIRVRFKWS